MPRTYPIGSRCFTCQRPYGYGPDSARCMQFEVGSGMPGGPNRTVCDSCMARVYREVQEEREARRTCHCPLWNECPHDEGSRSESE